MEVDLTLWPEKPYRLMVEEVERAIGAQANFLVALGLFCYTEFMGRKVLKSKGSITQNNKDCFNTFFRDYMECGDLLMKHPDIYDKFRNGIAHNYYFKGQHSAVYHSFEDGLEEKFKKMGFHPETGILIFTKSEGLEDGIPISNIFITTKFLEKFKIGVNKFLQENNLLINT